MALPRNGGGYDDSPIAPRIRLRQQQQRTAQPRAARQASSAPIQYQSYAADKLNRTGLFSLQQTRQRVVASSSEMMMMMMMIVMREQTYNSRRKYYITLTPAPVPLPESLLRSNQIDLENADLRVWPFYGSCTVRLPLLTPRPPHLFSWFLVVSSALSDSLPSCAFLSSFAGRPFTRNECCYSARMVRA